jgi:hypothetical protein
MSMDVLKWIINPKFLIISNGSLLNNIEEDINKYILKSTHQNNILLANSYMFVKIKQTTWFLLIIVGHNNTIMALCI